jgi:hypothetical protein
LNIQLHVQNPWNWDTVFRLCKGFLVDKLVKNYRHIQNINIENLLQWKSLWLRYRRLTIKFKFLQYLLIILYLKWCEALPVSLSSYAKPLSDARKEPIYAYTFCIGQIAISCKVICVVKEVILQEHKYLWFCLLVWVCVVEAVFL